MMEHELWWLPYRMEGFECCAQLARLEMPLGTASVESFVCITLHGQVLLAARTIPAWYARCAGAMVVYSGLAAASTAV